MRIHVASIGAPLVCDDDRLSQKHLSLPLPFRLLFALLTS